MRSVAVKTEEQQARAMLFRTRDLLVRQRTQLINALRGHLAEHGLVAPQGPANVKGLAEAIELETTSLRKRPVMTAALGRRANAAAIVGWCARGQLGGQGDRRVLRRTGRRTM